jgi:hypothetical protein
MPTLPANPNTTTEARIALYKRVAAQLPAFLAIVTPMSLRRPGAAVPDTTFAEARALLADIRRLTAREPGRIELLVLHEPPSWAALASRLAFAANALAAFHSRYSRHDGDLLEHYWATPEQMESIMYTRYLEGFDQHLSPVSGEGA